MNDLQYAVRMFSKNPLFTTVMILTLALGIGANTAMFSVVNATLIRPLPFTASEKLVALFETMKDGSRNLVSFANAIDWKEQSRSFESMSPFIAQSVNLTGVEQPDRLRGGFVSSDFFRVLNVKSSHGRMFTAREDQPGGPRVAMLQHESWKARFAMDPQIVGKSLVLNGEPTEIISVLPADFQFPIDEIEVWLPAQHYPALSPSRSQRNFFVLARLHNQITIDQAQQEMKAISGRLAQIYPDTNKDTGVALQFFQESIVEDVRSALLILMGAVGLILLIACANTANLILSRNVIRQREMVVRAALGASRFRLIKQLLSESVLLAAAGGIVGVLLAAWGVEALQKIGADYLPGNADIGLDKRVLFFTLLISVAVGVLFGLLPSLQLARKSLFNTLREGSQRTGGLHSRLRNSFVIGQIALSLILLIGSGLLMRSFIRLLNVDLGVRTENLLTMEYRLPKNKYAEDSLRWNFHKQVLEKIQNVPGIVSVAIVQGLPFSGNGGSAAFVLPDSEAPAAGQEPVALFNNVSPDYFKTIGISMLRGRNFNDQDRLETTPAIVVNDLLAERFFPEGDAVGRQIRFPEFDISATIIGIVRSTRQYDVGEKRKPQIYTCYCQNPGSFATIVAKTAVEPMTLSNAVKSALWSVDKDQPVWKIRTLEFLVEENLASKSLLLRLMGSFAILALVLTLLGLYGVISYSVSRQTQEIGVRIALGAQRTNIMRLVLRQGMLLIATGISIGLAGSWMLTRLLSNMLFDIRPTDPITFLAVSALLFLVGLAGSYLPARKATRIDPLSAIRYE